jgi:DNA-binding GntR family transcriptional regulator
MKKENNKKMNIDKSTLSEKVSTLISDMIHKGKFKPGERLTETSLSKLLGFSRTPIREALRQLEKEGFIYIVPRKGATVTLLTERDIEEIFLLKYKLETLAIVLALEHLDKEDITYLERLNKRLKDLKGNKSVSSLIDINSKFHSYIINKCYNHRLIKMLGDISAQFNRATAFSFEDDGRIGEVIIEHEDIMEAIKKRDEKMVEEAMEKHVYKGWQFIKDKFATKEQK